MRENRTEALDASRNAIRRREVVLPRAGKLMEEFAEHLTADVKRFIVDDDTGQQAYRYVKGSGPNHYSLAFTYDCIAWAPTRPSVSAPARFVSRPAERRMPVARGW